MNSFASATRPQSQTPPELSSDYPLSAQQIEGYRQNGHVLLRNLLSPEELAFYREAINSTTARFNTETRPLEERDTYGKAFLQVGNLWVRDETVRRFTLAKRFAKIAADLMGVEGVRLYHDQALYKEPGGGVTPWHQDQQYWPLDTSNTITMWMPLVPLCADVGSMTFVSKTHLEGELRPLDLDSPISDQSQSDFDRLIAERQLPQVHYGTMNAGDATFHAGWTLHSAPSNPTKTMREVMTVIYYADGARVAPPTQKFQEDDRKAYLPDALPGEVAAGDLTPLVYRRS